MGLKKYRKTLETKRKELKKARYLAKIDRAFREARDGISKKD